MLYRKILFFYSVFASLLFLSWVILFLPRPENLILLLLFLPIPLHFFLGIVWKPKTKEDNTKGKAEQAQNQGRRMVRLFLIILLTVFISTLSILIYSVFYERYLQKADPGQSSASDFGINLEDMAERLGELEALNIDILNQLKTIGEDLRDSGDENKRSTLGESEEIENSNHVASSSGYIQITKQGATDVYESNTSSSKVIGRVEFNKVYPFTNNVGGWYQITLPDIQSGWVRSQYAKEI